MLLISIADGFEIRQLDCKWGSQGVTMGSFIKWGGYIIYRWISGYRICQLSFTNITTVTSQIGYQANWRNTNTILCCLVHDQFGRPWEVKLSTVLDDYQTYIYRSTQIHFTSWWRHQWRYDVINKLTDRINSFLPSLPTKLCNMLKYRFSRSGRMRLRTTFSRDLFCDFAVE